jgi:hypothetical protein
LIKTILKITRPAWAGFKNCGTRLPPYQGNKIGTKIGSKIGSIIGRLDPRLNQKSDPILDQCLI